MTTKTPVADESSDTANVEPKTKVAYIRENGAIISCGHMPIAASGGGEEVWR